MVTTGIAHEVPTLRAPHANQLAINQLLDVLWIAISLQRDLGSSTVDLTQIVRCEFYVNRSYVLLKTMQFGRAWDRNDPRFLGE